MRDAGRARYEKDPEMKRARNDDADPGSKRDAERARWYQKGPGSKRVGEHKRYLDHAETRRAVKSLHGSDLNTASHVLDNKKS